MDKPEFSFRPYTPADEAACLALFDSNTPQFFGPAERAGFEDFLKRQPCPFFVVEAETLVIACGGYGVGSTDGDIVLAWGMVRGDLHRQGAGTFLLEQRLQRIFQENPAAKVIIDTSQHSQSFFARFGFHATQLTENYYAPGLHRVDMELEMHSSTKNTKRTD